MRQTGLSNRFPETVRSQWIFWYSCHICGRNRWDALHHIVSPSSRLYVRGAHNASVYNSAPIHNYGCHIDNEAFLYNDENIKMLLGRTREALDGEGYTPNGTDREFLRVYAHLYA